VQDSTRASLQAALFEFAIVELVRHHRESFAPLWTVDSWAKLMIWLALNSGCSSDSSSLAEFAEALGPILGARLRRLFFERELEDLDVRVMADPAESRVLLLPLGEAGAAPSPAAARAALERVGLLGRVETDAQRWRRHDSLLEVPWRQEPPPA
jgi:hypothetical protein